MGRPRTGTELRKTITVSLSPEAITRLATMGTNRSAIIESLILGPKPPDLRAALDAKIAAIPARKKPANSGNCSHPRDTRVVHSWGATCGTCNARVP